MKKKETTKQETANRIKPVVSGSVAFAKWIGERMNKDSWFKYDARFGTWYWHMKGHLTTEELYEVFVATDR